jgi:mannose/cellobiose epimerase-like protein (N-acyl-D-glucosamine 2-epimerase family)
LLQRFSHRVTLMGVTVATDPETAAFELRCRSGDVVRVRIGREIWVRPLMNLDGLPRDRLPPPRGGGGTPRDVIRQYVALGALTVVEGVLLVDHGTILLDARSLHVLHSSRGQLLFEEADWWVAQATGLADAWLAGMFGASDEFDFHRYRTSVGLTGAPRGDTQECATLSRLVYGLSSAYLLTGSARYLQAARAGVRYQRDQFRLASRDGHGLLWAFGRRGRTLLVASESHDDAGAMPLYEQIYALAGLAQYYRATLDREVLEDIRRTLSAFNRYYRDSEHGGYYSHIDAATWDADSAALGDNRLRKNWNSIGDHLPAYLVNLLLALDPLPEGPGAADAAALRRECLAMMDETTTLIVERFVTRDEESAPFVHERFLRDWTPDRSWGWQRDRAIVGHNLKIAWTLARVAAYHRSLGAAGVRRAEELVRIAELLGTRMAADGVDTHRGGVFDALERRPGNGMPQEFTWGNHKDFWQQEQGILAYLSLHGATSDTRYLDLARETAAFYNLFFLDHRDGGIYFRVTDDGLPYLLGDQRDKGGHAISGYHSLELCYLAHAYTRTYVDGKGFCLHFRPEPGAAAVNVLPDFIPPSALRLRRVVVAGEERRSFPPDRFQVELGEGWRSGEVRVELEPVAAATSHHEARSGAYE